MRLFIKKCFAYLKGADWILLGLCCAASIYGIVAIASATAYSSAQSGYVTVQIAALLLGILAYLFFSVIDLDIFAEQNRLLYLFCLVFISMLYIWGRDDGTGNRAWMVIPYVGVSIQPSEVCKVLFIIILAQEMTIRRDKLNSPVSILVFALLVIVIVGLYMDASNDAGSAISFLIIFIFLAIGAGISFGWFLGGFAAICAAVPVLWSTGIIRDYMKNRILVVYDPTIDPMANNERYQMDQTQTALGSGKMFGQGYGNGKMTGSGSIPAQHTDCIFSVIGEELGFIGCMVVMIILAAIVIRCLLVGLKTPNFTSRLVCIGIAGMLMFQIIVNIGLNLGVLPVIGLTLPFFSYGGSSLVMTFAAMGIVSGIHKRPESDSSIRYVRPPITVKV